jgi:hypothetical protein
LKNWPNSKVLQPPDFVFDFATHSITSFGSFLFVSFAKQEIVRVFNDRVESGFFFHVQVLSFRSSTTQTPFISILNNSSSQAIRTAGLVNIERLIATNIHQLVKHVIISFYVNLGYFVREH